MPDEIIELQRRHQAALCRRERAGDMLALAQGTYEKCKSEHEAALLEEQGLAKALVEAIKAL